MIRTHGTLPISPPQCFQWISRFLKLTFRWARSGRRAKLAKRRADRGSSGHQLWTTPTLLLPDTTRTIAAGNGEQDVVREQRRLAAIVAADVVGYSRLMGRDEAGTVARLRQVRAERLQPVPGVWSRNLKRRCRLTKRTSGSPNTPRTNSSGRKPANRYPSDRRRRRFRSLPILQRDKNPRRSKSRKPIIHKLPARFPFQNRPLDSLKRRFLTVSRGRPDG